MLSFTHKNVLFEMRQNEHFKTKYFEMVHFETT